MFDISGSTDVVVVSDIDVSRYLSNYRRRCCVWNSIFAMPGFKDMATVLRSAILDTSGLADATCVSEVFVDILDLHRRLLFVDMRFSAGLFVQRRPVILET